MIINFARCVAAALVPTVAVLRVKCYFRLGQAGRAARAGGALGRGAGRGGAGAVIADTHDQTSGCEHFLGK